METKNNGKVILPQFEPIIESDGTEKKFGVNIVWKKKNKTQENITFTLCTTFKEAIEKLLKLKGGWDKIDILSIQIYDRTILEYRDYPILSTDEDGVICILKKEWEEIVR